MGNNIRSMPTNSKTQSISNLGSNYFKNNYSTAEERMAKTSIEALSIPEPTLYGVFQNVEHYLKTLNLLMLSTIEPQHKEEILLREVVPNLKHHRNLLDIGVGRGDLTQIIGKHFDNITAIDNSEEALKNLPEFIESSPIHKVKGDILDYNSDVYSLKYDMILLSHTIYYIPEKERIPLIEEMTQILTDTGVLVIVFNDEGDRSALVKHYGAIDSGFGPIHYTLPQIHNNFYLYRIDEFLDGGDLNSMMHIAGICLNDYGLNATKEDLSNYLTENYCPNNICQLNMTQNIMVIGQDGDY